MDFFLRVTIPFEFELEEEFEHLNDIEPVSTFNEPVNSINEPVNGNYEPVNDNNEPANAIGEPENAVDEPEKLSESEYLVYSVITTSPNISKDKIAVQIGKSRATVTRSLAKMVKKGLIQRIGSDKKGYWQIINLSPK